MLNLKEICFRLFHRIARSDFCLRLTLPLPGLGCGVLGLALPKVSVTIGEYASKLLKAYKCLWFRCSKFHSKKSYFMCMKHYSFCSSTTILFITNYRMFYIS